MNEGTLPLSPFPSPFSLKLTESRKRSFELCFNGFCTKKHVFFMILAQIGYSLPNRVTNRSKVKTCANLQIDLYTLTRRDTCQPDRGIRFLFSFLHIRSDHTVILQCTQSEDEPTALNFFWFR